MDELPRLFSQFRAIKSSSLDVLLSSSTPERRLPCPLVATTDLHNKEWDGIVLVTNSLENLVGPLEFLRTALEQAKKVATKKAHPPRFNYSMHVQY